MKDFPDSITRHFDFHHREYERAIEWFRAQKLNINSTRYVSVMRELGDIGPGQYPAELIWAMSEVDTLYRVYLSVLKEQDLGKKNIRKLLNGQKFLKDEKLGDSENSRNYLFELSLGGIFSDAGLDVDFDTIADFKFPISENHQAYVECKRAGTLGKLQDNVDEAYDQIQLRCGEQDVGIVAVDVSRLMWLHFEQQLVHSYACDAQSYLEEAFFKIVENIKVGLQNKNTIMLIGYYYVPIIRLDDESIRFHRDLKIDIKYHEKHLRPPYNLTTMHRARTALQLSKILANHMLK